jgi:hypothetical protein
MLMATLLARMPDLRHQVMTDHRPDEHGQCRDCEGAQWPCELYVIADRAERLLRLPA